jgi:hypothetical protein
MEEASAFIHAGERTEARSEVAGGGLSFARQARRPDLSMRPKSGRGTVSLSHTSATAGAIDALAETLD